MLTNGLDGAGEALRILVNEASKIERNHFLNAQPHERTIDRIDYANGFKPKTVMTRVGELTFEVPQVRGGGFYPSALEKGSRTEQALNIALAEMYVQGVSTRKVITVLQSLLGPEVSISSTQVSRAAEQLDAGLSAWRERPLDEAPYVFLDARYERVREAGRLVDCAVLVAVGITPRWASSRAGCIGRLVRSRSALARLPRQPDPARLERRQADRLRRSCRPQGGAPGDPASSVPWQRCQFHLQQNAQAYVTRLDQRKPVAQRIRSIFNAPDRVEAERLLKQAVQAWATDAPKLAQWAEDNLPEGFTAFDSPHAQRMRLRTTNGLERINREIKRRTRVASIFPNTASCLRLVSALLAECDEEWMTGKIYLNLQP